MSDIKRAIALGFFDGVHIGHGALLEKTKERAAQSGASPAVLSFDVHPDNLVFGRETPLINSAEDRTDVIRRIYGIDDVVFLHFNRVLMEMPWREFIENIISQLNIGWIVVGHDFCFGYKGEGTARRLKDYCLAHDIGCDIIPPVMLDGRVVSSTYIRSLIAQGDMEQARRYLGHPYFLTNTVCSGYHLGTKMGTPTTNIFFPQGVLVPRHGVYVTRVVLQDGRSYAAATNVGVRPTVSNSARANVESHILDFSGNLYGQKARVEFYSFIRPEMKFDDVQILSSHIKHDSETAKNYFA
ncbi:MAG TPA: bifunctional riboflavin kinase/FAD synthetase [Candidatus Limivicinus faecipullorum]|nr:bifunctional riboflavin kinase/FAD synthetase [Candidatus Limivicinus faecipullorum]